MAVTGYAGDAIAATTSVGGGQRRVVKFLLICHGETACSADGARSDDPNFWWLTARGIQQSEALAAKLALEPCAAQIRAVYATTRCGALQTAELIADQLGLTVQIPAPNDDRAGGQDRGPIAALGRRPETPTLSTNGKGTAVVGYGSRTLDLIERQYPGMAVIVVGECDALLEVESYLNHAGDDNPPKSRVDAGSVTEWERLPLSSSWSLWRCNRRNDTAHFPPHLSRVTD
ncbi:histidine phosphatase family protein [Nocardia sp. NPDC003963]